MENKEYKEAVMSDQLKLRIISSCENLESFDEKHGKKSSKKAGMCIAVVAAAVVLMLTFSVSALGNWDYAAVFSHLFGSSVDNATYTYSHPEVEVMSNTFDGLDIAINGIAATDNILYMLFDITATDGSIFDTTDIGNGGIYTTALGNKINLHNPHHCSTYFFGYDPEIETRIELNGLSFGGNGGTSFIDVPDGNELDNHMSLALVEGLDLCDYRGSTVVLSINSIEHNGKIVKEGTWKAKFTVPKQQSKEINLDVNQKTSMLRNEVFDYTSSNEYVYDEIEINNVKLNALNLEYTWSANDDYLLTHTFHAWIEMKDGSTIGYPDITEAAHNGMFLGGGHSNGMPLGGSKKCIFNEPINMENVKAIHIGSNLVINVD